MSCPNFLITKLNLDDVIQEFWVGRVLLILTYHHDTRSVNTSNSEPLLYVQWLHRVDALNQSHTMLPLDLYIPFYTSSEPKLYNFGVVSPSTHVYCPCFVHTISGEPRVPRLTLPVPANDIMFLNVALTLGSDDFSKQVIALHANRYDFTPRNYADWAPS